MATKERKITIEVFKDGNGEWRWHARSSNGKLIATAGEGFKRRSDAKKSAHSLIEHFAAGAWTFDPAEKPVVKA